MSFRRSAFRVLMVLLILVGLAGLPMAAGAQTVNGIKTPKDGATVSGQVDVAGYANSPNFEKWQLDLLPNANPDQAIFLALGTQPGVFTYTLNTTPYPAGTHALRLRVVHKDSNYDEFTNKVTFGAAAAKPAAAAPAVKATAPVTPTLKAAAPVTPTVKATAPVTATAAAKPAAAPTANGVTAPKDGAAVSGQVGVAGYASSPNFKKWQLDLLPNGNADQAIFLALGTKSGVVTYTLNTASYPPGTHGLRLRVVRNDSNYDEFTNKVTFGAAAPKPATPVTTTVKSTAPVTPTVKATAPVTPTVKATAPVTATTAATAAVAENANGIKVPKPGATIAISTPVMGYANSPNFEKWQLDLLPSGNPDQAVFLAFGTQSGVFTYTLFTAPYPAGEHALRLRVVRTDSNYDEYLSKVKFVK